MPAQAMLNFLIFMTLAITIGSLIGAMILRAAVALYNYLAGSAEGPDSVPEPPLGKAFVITFVTALANGVAGYAVGQFTAAARSATNSVVPRVDPIAQLISLPVGILIMSGLLAAMLPTAFMRAFLVTMLNYVVVVAIIAGVGSTAYLYLR